jgi:hypothetical protein
MKIYAEVPAQRFGQLIGDSVIVLWCVLWIVVGVWVHDLFVELAGPGEFIEQAGVDLEDRLVAIGDEMSGVPVVGDRLQGPFVDAAGAGRSLAAAGQRQQDVVHTIAVWLGVLFALIPALFAVGLWLPGRLRWIREATAAHRIRVEADDLYLFALRAVATRPLPELLRATPDPTAAFLEGDYGALAELELNELGLRSGPRMGR